MIHTNFLSMWSATPRPLRSSCGDVRHLAATLGLTNLRPTGQAANFSAFDILRIVESSGYEGFRTMTGSFLTRTRLTREETLSIS